MSRRLRILTWHVHGNYLYNLTQVPHDWWLVTDAARSAHHAGRAGRLPWGDNVHEVPIERVRDMDFDVVLFQSRREWDEAFAREGLRVDAWRAPLGLYPRPGAWVFERGLHFAARLVPVARAD